MRSWNKVPYLSFPGKQTLGRQFACRTLMGERKGSSTGQREKLDWNAAQQRSQPSQMGALEFRGTLQSCPCLRQGDQRAVTLMAASAPSSWGNERLHTKWGSGWSCSIRATLCVQFGWALVTYIFGSLVWFKGTGQGRHPQLKWEISPWNQTFCVPLGASVVRHAIFWDP